MKDGVGKAEGRSWAAQEVHANGSEASWIWSFCLREESLEQEAFLWGFFFVKGNFPVTRAFPGLLLTKIISPM